MQANISYATTNVCSLVSSMGQPWLAFSPALACQPLQKFIIKLPELQFDGTVFEFVPPLELTLYREDGAWTCEQRDFSIVAFGQTPEEAVHSFSEDLSVLWDEIAQAPDDALSKEAWMVKLCLLSAVKSVTVR